MTFLNDDGTLWHPEWPKAYRDQIITGDARQLAQRIPDDSVDMVFCDPPYPKEYLYLYDWLASESVRILKPGGWAFVYGGWIIPDIYERLTHKGWDYYMTIALVNRGGYPRWWSKKLMIGFKPVYVFTKGTPTIQRWQSNVAQTDLMDKRYHKWGQGIGLAVEKIDMFTPPGGVVVDYFAGGGQVAAACIVTGRHYTCFEFDDRQAEIARLRAEGTQRPLVIPVYEQMALELEPSSEAERVWSPLGDDVTDNQPDPARDVVDD